MMRKANKARGEVAVTLGGEPLILCATMENLGEFNTAMGKLDLSSVMQNIGARNPTLTGKILEALAISGDAKKAWTQAVGVASMTKAVGAITEALFPDDDGEPGNAEAEQESP